MLTIALVVMVIFLFLRTLAATIIPSIAVPLSLVGTFGVMYLLGYSLDNLSLMALTISTGFVVDDAIVMIENIERYIEEGDTPLEAALQGAGADRLHHRFADRVADRRADPAALHGRHRRPVLPRIRGDAERDHSGVGGHLADADADDVRALLRTSARRSRAVSIAVGERLQQRSSRSTAARCSSCCKHQTRTLLVTVGTLVADLSSSTSIVPKGFSRCRTPA